MVQVLPFQRLLLTQSQLPSCSNPLFFSVSHHCPEFGAGADSGLDCAISLKAKNLHPCVLLYLKNMKITYL